MRRAGSRARGELVILQRMKWNQTRAVADDLALRRKRPRPSTATRSSAANVVVFPSLSALTPMPWTRPSSGRWRNFGSGEPWDQKVRGDECGKPIAEAMHVRCCI
jgi:hypothetical protein